MTTDVAKSLGLVEGVDYVRGDKFPGSSKLYTAKFLGDPVQTTIKALDTAAKDPKKQAFYTAHNEPRWRYIAMSDQKWLAMSDEQKRATIAQMYNAEGGNGSLTGGSKGSTIDQYLAQQEQNPQFIYTLSQDQQTVLRNAMLQRGMTIPEKLSDTTQNKLREARATFASADSLLKSIESLTKKVITATSPTQIPFQWLKRTIGGKTKSNSDAAVFASTINAFTSLLTRAAGEKGVLTDQDVLRIKQALPSLFDTKKVADQKLATLRSIYASIKQGAVDAYSVPGASASGVDLRTKYGY
jgi:hypothetical protein